MRKRLVYLLISIIILMSFSFLGCTAQEREAIVPGLAATTTIKVATTKAITTEQTTTDTTIDVSVTTEANITSESTVTTENAATESVKYGDGIYLVGKDIQSGLYKAVVADKVMKIGYIERAKDVSMESDSILANIILTGDGYFEIKDTDVAVKLQGVEISPINLKDLTPNIKTEVSDGIYLVGFDIKPGTYKTEVTDTTMKIGYVERLKDVSMNGDAIIANEVLQGPGYVKIKESDFAVRVQGAKLTLQE